MFFRVQDLEVRDIRFEVDLPPGELPLPDDVVRQTDTLHVVGVATLLQNGLEEIRVKGQLTGTVHSLCDRCLDPVSRSVDSDFNLLYRPLTHGPENEELEIDPSEAEVGFYSGDGVDLNDVLREQIFLTIPMQLVCRDGCKGICPVCGQDRNQSACACQTKPADDRWAGLREFKMTVRSAHE